MLRFLSAGESHGPALSVMLDGVPAGLELIAADHIDPWLRRRQGGYGRGRRMVIESDCATILAGVRAGFTTGAPLSFQIENRDWRNWTEIMSPLPGGEPRKKALTAARPGHADLSGGIKYGHKDLRDVLERASARETASRVAAGAVALRILETVGVQACARMVSLGGIPCDGGIDWDDLDALDDSPLRTFDKDAEAAIITRIDEAKKAGDTLGGVVEARFRGLPVGLGSHTQWDRKLDGRLAQAAMSIQAIKGVEIGDGWEAAMNPGSRVHDAIYHQEAGYYRETNRAGGLEAGITTGEDLVVRAAMKPIATLMTPLPTVDVTTHEAADAARERSDTTAVPAASIVVLAMTALVLADAVLEKFGADTVREITERAEAHRRYAAAFLGAWHMSLGRRYQLERPATWVALSGFMGTGKSRIGWELSRRLGLNFIDTDRVIERVSCLRIPDLFELYGEAVFRDYESEVVRRCLRLDDVVISTGGGTVMRPDNRDMLLGRGPVIVLTASPETIYKRTRRHKRPLLEIGNPIERIRELMDARQGAYDAAASLKVSTDGRFSADVVEEIVEQLWAWREAVEQVQA